MSQSPQSDIPVQPGSILAGKYRVERIIGKGGMGVVVEARHVALDERVALKFLLPDYAQHPEASQRFQREARASVKIKGEHVARVSDVGTLENGSPYMVMEYLDGIDLSNALEKYGVCQIPDAIDYVLQASEAIAEAHGHGIVHRDLKPANMFLTRRPDGTPMVKVLDFGISKMSGGGVDNLTKTTAAMGSALYMSPEQMQQTRGVDHRTDIYALGISLYELIAGKQPFFADTLPQLCAEVLTGVPTPIRQMRPEVSDGLANALEKAYAREKEARYQTIAELAAGLAPYAPPRSQSTLDRIARMAGLTPPVAGAAARGLSQSNPSFSASGPQPALANAAQSGGYPAAQSGGYPAARPGIPGQTGDFGAQGSASTPGSNPPPAGVPGQTGNFGAAGAQGVSPSTGDLQQPIAIVSPSLAIGGYQAPLSTKAAAAFAAGASTNTNLSSTSGLSKPPSGKAGLAVVFIVLLGAGGVFFWLRSPGEPGPASGSSAIGTATASAAAATDAPAASASATAAATAEPTADPAPTSSASAAASASTDPAPTATPTASASASAAVVTKPKGGPIKTGGSQSKPQQGQQGVMTSR